MTFSLTYILYRIFYRFIEFWKHWYIEVFFTLRQFRVDAAQKFDTLFSATSFFTRPARVSLLLLVEAVSWGVYVLWSALPAFILYQAFKNYF